MMQTRAMVVGRLGRKFFFSFSSSSAPKTRKMKDPFGFGSITDDDVRLQSDLLISGNFDVL
jgi:hypothetical protein